MAQRWSVCLQCGRPGFDPWVRKIPWRRKWQPTPVFLPRESHGQRSLAGYGPWGCKSRTWLSDSSFYQPGHFSLREYLQPLNSPGWWTECTSRKAIFCSWGETEWRSQCLSKSNIPASSSLALQKAWKWKVKVKSLSRVWLSVTPWTVPYQVPPYMGFSRQENWSGLLFPSPGDLPDPGVEPRPPAL